VQQITSWLLSAVPGGTKAISLILSATDPPRLPPPMSTSPAGSKSVEAGAVGVTTWHRSSVIISKIPCLPNSHTDRGSGESRSVVKRVGVTPILAGASAGVKFPGRMQIYRPRLSNANVGWYQYHRSQVDIPTKPLRSRTLPSLIALALLQT
jgi:hypothetical protein